MKNAIKRYGISLIAVTISVFALCHTCPRIIPIDKCGNTDLGFDYIGVIVGVLSILVTFLLGWNISTVIDFKSKVKKAQHDYKKLEDKIKETDQKAFDANISTNYALYQFYNKNKEYPGAITSLIIALANMVEIDLGNPEVAHQ